MYIYRIVHRDYYYVYIICIDKLKQINVGGLLSNSRYVRCVFALQLILLIER